MTVDLTVDLTTYESMRRYAVIVEFGLNMDGDVDPNVCNLYYYGTSHPL